MADDSWYSKLAKDGWLGTKAQVSATYGQPTWGSAENEDPKAKAIKSLAKKMPSTDTSAGS